MILKVISNYKMTLFENGIQISTKRWMESLVDMNWSSTQWQCFDFDLYFFLGCLKFVFAFHQRKSGLYLHEEKSCSCKSNIFYLTYLAVSCLAHTRLGEWFIFDWHGPLDVRDLVCWPGPSMSLDFYVWISYEIPYFFSFQNDQHTVWLLRDSSCISFVALHEHLDIGKRTPLIRNFIDREGREKRERLTNYPDQCWLTTE
jgi:hypothetical protein